MDRFIGHKVKLKFIRSDNLKSNMDRFIAVTSESKSLFVTVFKIQYG